MTKARISVENDTVDADIRAEAEELAQLNEDEGGEIFRAIEEMRGSQGTVVVIVKLSPAEEAGICDNIPVAEFTIDELKRRYGVGSYRVRMRGPKGWIPGGGNVKISNAGTRSKEAGAHSGGDFQTFLEYTQRQEAERKSRTDDWIKLVLAAVAPIIAAWLSRPSSQGPDIAALVTALKPAPGPSLADLSTAMVNMKTMTEPKEANGSMVDTIFKAFEFAQSMGGEKEGAGPGGSSWVDVIRDLIKAAPEAIKPMLEARMAAMQAGQPVRQVPPQIPTAPTAAASTPVQNPSPGTNFVGPAANTPNSETDMMSAFMPLVKVNLSKVANWAEKDRDPAVYAEVLIDELPDNFGAYIPLTDVLNHLNNEQWFEIICGIEPRLQPHREWCDECRLAVIEVMKSIETDVTPPAEEIKKTEEHTE